MHPDPLEEFRLPSQSLEFGPRAPAGPSDTFSPARALIRPWSTRL